MRFFINPVKAVLCLMAVIVFLFLSSASWQSGKPMLGIFYTLLCLVYMVLTMYFSTLLEIDEMGIRNRFLFWTFNSILWNEIREVGIGNLKVMKNTEKKKIGEVYLYFSKTVLTEKERFGMCLHWPPRDKRYMQYSVRRLKKVRNYWHEKPVLAWMTEEAYLDKYFK